jgi:hypothetical protein
MSTSLADMYLPRRDLYSGQVIGMQQPVLRYVVQQPQPPVRIQYVVPHGYTVRNGQVVRQGHVERYGHVVRQGHVTTQPYVLQEARPRGGSYVPPHRFAVVNGAMIPYRRC